MEEIKLYQKLRSLSQEEFQAFIAFADSPYFNTDKQIRGLLRLLLPAHPGYAETPAIAKNTLIKKLGLKSEESLRHLRTRTLRLLPAFLAQQELKQQPNTDRLLLLDALKRRKLDKELRREIDDFEAHLSPDDRPFHALFRLDDFRLHELLRNQESPFVFQQYIDSGNRYFLLKKLELASDLLLFQQIYRKPAGNDLFVELDFLLSLHSALVGKNVTLDAWRLTYELLKNPADTRAGGLLQLKAHIEANRAKIPAQEQKNLFNTVNNLLIGKLNRGHFNTLPELNWVYQTLYEYYRYADQENLLEEDGFILPGRFKNAMAAACICGHTEWARAFVHSNLPRVISNDREELHALCLASIAFYEHDFKTAADQLVQISGRGNEFYFFDAESVQTRIFYLADEYEPFEARMGAVRKKMKTSSLAQAHLDNYGNYFSLLKEMFQLKIHPGTTGAQWAAFREKVERTNPVNQKKWLLEHIPV